MSPYSAQYPYYMQDQEIDPVTGLPIQNPYAPAVSPTVPGMDYSRSGATDQITSEEDPQRAAMQDRRWAYGRGEDLDRGIRDNQAQAELERTGYTEQARNVYDPLIEGRGGIPAADMENVLRRGELDTLAMTPEEIQEAGLSDVERQAIQGDANSRRKYFNPGFENDIFNEGAGFRRGTVDAYERNLAGSYDPGTLRGTVDAYGEGLRGSYDAGALRPTEGFAAGLTGAAGEYGSNARQILDPSKLTTSDQFLQEYRMSPEEQQRIVTGAGLTTGNRDKAAIAEAERRSRAAGVNPSGVAALRARSSRAMNADAADAMTQARIRASGAAADRLRTGEDMRLSYGQNLAGMRAGAERDINDAAYRAAVTGEQTRLGAERDVADRGMRVADAAGQARIASERDLADRGMQVADASGRIRLGNEQDIARERLALQQNITRVGNEAERDVDDVNSARARDLSLNRQGTAQYNQAQRYGRGVAASDRLSDRYRYGADATRADAQEGRGFVRSQVDQANQNAQRAADRRVNIYGTQGQLGQGATRTQAQIDAEEAARPKWWERAAGLVIGGAGAAAGLGFKPSDEQVKEDIQQVGSLDNDLPVYRYRYKGTPTFEIGVMAQDVEKVNPEAVKPINGIKHVNYLKATADKKPDKGRSHAAYSQQYRYAS